MARPQSVENVKLFAAVLFAQESAFGRVQKLLEGRWGKVDFCGPARPFDMTDYYESEMGTDLKRRLLSFETLVAPESLCEAKLITNSFEDQLAQDNQRRANLDIGYLDHNKIVLASVKYAGQKIHLGKGIYADLIARYRQGRYRPFEWTFPDFRDGRYDDELEQIRQTYLRQRHPR